MVFAFPCCQPASAPDRRFAALHAGGDIAKAPGSIIDGIAAGRSAASSIDMFLGGDGNIDETFVEIPPIEPGTGRRDKGFADLKRVKMPFIPLSERHDGFREVELGLSHDQATREAKRCLHCDLELCLAEKTGKEPKRRL